MTYNKPFCHPCKYPCLYCLHCYLVYCNPATPWSGTWLLYKPWRAVLLIEHDVSKTWFYLPWAYWVLRQKEKCVPLHTLRKKWAKALPQTPPEPSQTITLCETLRYSVTCTNVNPQTPVWRGTRAAQIRHACHYHMVMQACRTNNSLSLFKILIFCSSWVFALFFQSEYNCFNMLCYFLLYNKVSQLYFYIYPTYSFLSLPPTPHIPPF